VTAYGNDGRTGEFAVRGVARPEVAWRVPLGGPVTVTPVPAGDLLIVVAGRDLSGVDSRTGEARWRHDLNVPGPRAAFSTAPAVWRDWLVVTESVHEHALVFEHATGALVRDEPSGGCPTVVGDVLLIDDLHHGARAIRLPTWQPSWQRDNLGSLSASPALGPDATAYAAQGFEANHIHGGLTAYAVATGEKVFEVADWTEPCPVLGEAEDDWLALMPAHPVYAEGLVWVVAGRSHDGWGTNEILGLEPAGGRPRWSFDLGMAEPGDPDSDPWVPTGSVAVAGGAVYASAHASDHLPARLSCVDTRNRQPRWMAPVSGVPVGPPVLARDCVYLATSAGTLHALDRDSGAPRWSLEIGEPVPGLADGADGYREASAAVLPADGIVFVRTAGGVVAIRDAA
jgi:outer membrane protein assembly factor BamB